MSTVAPLVHHEHPARWVQDVPAVPVLPRQRNDGDLPTGHAVVYGSFSCPWSYLASQRTDLVRDPALRPTWRMVDPDAAPGTRLSAPGLRLDPPAAERAATDLDAVRALLLPGEHLPARPPVFVPHTGPAVAGYAEAVGAGVGDQVRRLLFDAYWQEGADIGLPEVLRRLLQAPLQAGTSAVRPVRDSGYAVTLTGGPITTDAYRRTRAWQQRWLTTGTGALPALAADGTATHGPAALVALAALSPAGPPSGAASPRPRRT